MNRLSLSERSSIVLFVSLAIVSTSAKVLLAGAGHNIDLESWKLLAELVLDGKVVYAETERNNWGPIWCHLVAATRYVQIHLLGTDSLENFHQLLALVLSLVDVAIAYLLARHHSLVVGALFLINPVSLLLTGFHTQFENLAILFALGACLLLDEDDKIHPVKFGLAMLMLGISLVAKHVLIFLPIWFFFRPKLSRLRRLASLLPLGVFAASFLPYIRDERALEGIVEHVLLYDSFHLDGFFPYLVQAAFPLKAIELLFSWVPVFSGFQFVWLAAMLLMGFAVREKGYQEQLLIYLVAMVVFSSALADQYLVIPLITCAVFWRHFTAWWYVLMTAVYLSSSPVNIGMLPSMAPLAETLQGLGLNRVHSVAALFVFLLLYLIANRRSAAATESSLRLGSLAP